MSVIAVGIIGLVVLLLILAGAIIGWTVGTNDEHIDVLAKRLAAEHRMEQATRATLHAMRDALRQRGNQKMVNHRGPSMPGSILGAVFMLIAVAAGARVVYGLLAPLLPSLIAVAVVGFILMTLFRRRQPGVL